MVVRLIEYDISMLDDPKNVELPEKMEIPDSIQRKNYTSESDYYAAITDYISDETGFLVKSYFIADEEK